MFRSGANSRSETDDRTLGRKKRIQELRHTGETRVGPTVEQGMACQELCYLIDQYQTLQKRIQVHEDLL